MTISAFCRDQLLTHGPLSVQALADLAVDAGKTAARDPANAVRSAIAHKEVLLPDGRWATPLWLLEGRILTARWLPLEDGWPGQARYDEYDPLLDDPLLDEEPFLENPEPENPELGDPFLEDADLGDPFLEDADREHPDRADPRAEDPAIARPTVSGTWHDVALLDMAARSGSVPLADGGFLHSHPQNSAWRAPKSWPRIRPGRSELLGLRVRAGQIHVELVPVTEELRRAGRKLAGEVGPLSPRGRYWATDDYLVSQKLVAALWSRMAADPAFLTQPVPPFSECIPALASAVHREHERRREQARHWRPQLDLPAALHDVAVMGARRSGQPPQDWLSSFVSRSLRELSDRDEGMLDDACGEVLPLQPRLWRA